MRAFIIFLALIVIVGGFWFFMVNVFDKFDPNKTYSSSKFDFSFSYPKTYFLEEKEVGNGERGHYVIILTADTPENKAVREGRSPGREGPIAITIDIYQNNLDKLSIENWIRNVNFSNFKFSDGTLASTTIAQEPALEYYWSGLYEARSIVFAHGGNIFSVVATYMNPSDMTLSDLPAILESWQFNI